MLNEKTDESTIVQLKEICAKYINDKYNFDHNIVVKNLVKMSKKNTRIILYGSVNENDYDVFVAVRNIRNNTLESGWNRFSIKTIERKFLKYGL